MASVIEKLALLNQEFYQFVNKALPTKEDERDKFIEEVEAFLKKREALIGQLEGTISANEKDIGKTVMTLHEKINERLQSIQQQMKADINQFLLKKQRAKKYDPYDGPSNEGIFFDKRGV